MMGWIGSGSELLLQAARALPDTIYTKQVVAEPGLWSKVTSVASGIMTITVIILTVALVPAAWNFRKSYKKVSDMLDKIYGDVNPLMRHASAHGSTSARTATAPAHSVVLPDQDHRPAFMWHTCLVSVEPS